MKKVSCLTVATAEVSETLEVSCNGSQEVGSSQKQSLTLTCTSSGTFSPNLTLEDHKCEEPAVCNEMPNYDTDTSGLVYQNVSTVLAYRYGTWVCNDSSLITDLGYKVKSLCGKEGTFDESVFANVSAITCREPEKCPEYVPYPTMESGLADSESVIKREGDEAVYQCKNTPQYLINGVDTEYILTCRKWGFPKPIQWPECIDPTATTTTTPKPITKPPCRCIGDAGVNNELLLNTFCRQVNITGNVFHYNGYTPVSRKKCGNRSPTLPTIENHCFCNKVEEQASE